MRRHSVPRTVATVAVVAVGALGLGTAGVLLGGERVLGQGQDEQAIEQVVRQAITVEHTLEVPPASYTGGPMSDAVQQLMLNRAFAELRKYYTGGVLGGKVSVIQEHIVADKSGAIRYLAGGLDSIAFRDVAISNDTALVTAEAVVWNKVAQDQNGTLVPATPRGPVDYTLTLVRKDGQWLITSENVRFPPGSGP